jgi:hypothetical protein
MVKEISINTGIREKRAKDFFMKIILKDFSIAVLTARIMQSIKAYMFFSSK